MQREDALQADVPEIKEHLHPDFVMAYEGHVPARGDSAKSIYHSPFRQDNDPSFEVYYGGEDRGWRVNDFADPDFPDGDVFDLVSRLYGLGFSETMAKCQELLAEQVESGYVRETPEDEHAFDEGRAQLRLNDARGHDLLDELIFEKSGLVGFNSSEWDVREDSHVLIPLFDEDEMLRGVTTRARDGEKRAIKGTEKILYGLWRLRYQTETVILTEGETDTWAAALAFPQHNVLGVLGANMSPERMWPEGYHPKKVILAFDPDSAGQGAVARWERFFGETDWDPTVVVVSFPDGKDVSDLPRAAFQKAVAEARPNIPRPPEIEEAKDGTHWCNASGKRNRRLASWTFELEERMDPATPGAPIGYAGTLSPTGDRVVITTEDLSSAARMRSWDRANGNYGWPASDAQTQDYAAFLRWKSHRLPKGRMATRLGVHDGDFVLPHDSYGLHKWHYVEPVAEGVSGAAFNHVHIVRPTSPANYHTDLMALVNSRLDPAETWPILCWLAAAPFRSFFNGGFPTLYIAGGSGAGKSTTTRVLVRAFSGCSARVGLSDTTRNGVVGWLGWTNGLPVFFDDYRTGARTDGMDAIKKFVIDSYDNLSSAKAGRLAEKAKNVESPTDCPVILGGEQLTTDKAVLDRSVLMYLHKITGSPEMRHALARVDAVSPELPGAYLEACFEGEQTFSPDDEIDPGTVNEPGLEERMQRNLGVLRFGYHRLLDFCPSLPEPDFSLVVDSWTRFKDHENYRDVVRWAYEAEKTDMVWDEGEHVAVHVLGLMANPHVRNFDLPGLTAASMEAFLCDRYGGEKATVEREYGPPISVVLVPKEEIL